MAIKPIGEVGRMYREYQITLNRYIERLIKENKLPKKAVLAAEVGMSYNEFVNAICINPRTPLERGKLLAIELELQRRDPFLYEAFLQEIHCNDNIRVAVGE